MDQWPLYASYFGLVGSRPARATFGPSSLHYSATSFADRFVLPDLGAMRVQFALDALCSTSAWVPPCGLEGDNAEQVSKYYEPVLVKGNTSYTAGTLHNSAMCPPDPSPIILAHSLTYWSRCGSSRPSSQSANAASTRSPQAPPCSAASPASPTISHTARHGRRHGRRSLLPSSRPPLGSRAYSWTGKRLAWRLLRCRRSSIKIVSGARRDGRRHSRVLNLYLRRCLLQS